jgi:hypothetical protein
VRATAWAPSGVQVRAPERLCRAEGGSGGCLVTVGAGAVFWPGARPGPGRPGGGFLDMVEARDGGRPGESPDDPEAEVDPELARCAWTSRAVGADATDCAVCWSALLERMWARRDMTTTYTLIESS